MNLQETAMELARLKDLERQLMRERGVLMAKARKLTAPATIDALTNMIDSGIRKGSHATYEQWQEAVESLLKELEGQP